MNLGHDLALYTGALTFKKPALPDLSCPDSTTQHFRDPPRSDDRCLRLSLLEVQAPEGNVGACARCATLGESLNLSGPQLLLGNPGASSGSSPHPLPPTLREKHLPSPPTPPSPKAEDEGQGLSWLPPPFQRIARPPRPAGDQHRSLEPIMGPARATCQPEHAAQRADGARRPGPAGAPRCGSWRPSPSGSPPRRYRAPADFCLGGKTRAQGRPRDHSTPKSFWSLGHTLLTRRHTLTDPGGGASRARPHTNHDFHGPAGENYTSRNAPLRAQAQWASAADLGALLRAQAQWARAAVLGRAAPCAGAVSPGGQHWPAALGPVAGGRSRRRTRWGGAGVWIGCLCQSLTVCSRSELT